MAYETLYDNTQDCYAPLMPGMTVSRGLTVSGSTVVPNSGGKTVTQIMNEMSHARPGVNIAGSAINAGKDAIMAEPYYRSNLLSDLISDVYDKFNQSQTDNPITTPTSALQYASSASNPVIDYLNADIAQHYGMSKETAYQEALANTSYQRAMADMQKAGLNPATIFGSGRGSGSGNVSYVSDNSASGFASNARSGDSEGSFLGDVQLMESIGALVSVALGKSASSGKTAGKALSTIASKLEGLTKK